MIVLSEVKARSWHCFWKPSDTESKWRRRQTAVSSVRQGCHSCSSYHWPCKPIPWAAPTVSYLWPTRTELSRKVSENRKFLGRNISVICPGSCRVTEIQITSCPSKKELFTSHFCDLYRSCAASRKSFLRLHFLIF